MLGKVIIFVALFLCWLVFSGETGWFYIITGLVSSAIGLFFAIRMNLISKLGLGFSFFPYLFWLAWQVVLSSLDIIKRVWKIRPIDPILEEIPTSQNSAIGHTIYGNSITMTPGTVTVDVDEARGTMFVHAISRQGLEDLKKGEMDRRVKKIIRGGE